MERSAAPSYVPLSPPQQTLDEDLCGAVFTDTYSSSAHFHALARGVPSMKMGDEAPELYHGRLHSAAYCTWGLAELTTADAASQILSVLTQGPPCL